jgi:hypothetical protein
LKPIAGLLPHPVLSSTGRVDRRQQVSFWPGAQRVLERDPPDLDKIAGRDL